MLAGYLIVALASVFLANSIPHLTRGGAGYLHRVPWRSPAQPWENALWGGANLIAGIWLAFWGATFDLFLPLALTVGVVGCAVIGTYILRDPGAVARSGTEGVNILQRSRDAICCSHWRQRRRAPPRFASEAPM